MIEHFRGCTIYEMDVVRSAWIREHPKFCRSCDGFGFVPIGEPSVETPGEQPCVDCLDIGVCPLCRAELVGDETDSVCCNCGWCDHPAHREDHRGAPPSPVAIVCTCNISHNGRIGT